MMADIFGAAAAAAGLLEVAIRLFQRVRKACERSKKLAELLQQHTNSVESINAIVLAIMDDDALQSGALDVDLESVHSIAARLVRCLKELEPGSKGRTRQVVHHLLRGTREEEELRDIMAELERAKMSLVLHVQLAGMGLTKMVRDLAIADAETVARIDRNLSLAAQPGSKRSFTFDSMTTLNDDDGDEITGPREMDVVAIGNTADDNAVQLLGPVGVNLWENSRIWTERNHASGQAIQIASSTDLETLKYLLDTRRRQEAHPGL
ncbi:hypothetical protein F5X68DRAFT_15877 [Plectosphaerella plurivora]|uniref:Fungal N-terminal domain-containing protein n=1 Tax=Plectosphaerella plurivora TaxID=936078 RepID=A0A9P8VAV3_9PEZI|nr:hypothetical protein F5X68DRAFT_15877 [Plectosphaerella plurivora]